MEDKSVVDCTLSNNIWWSRAHILIFGVLQVYSRWLLATSFCSDFDVYNGHMALCSCSSVQIWAPEQSVKQLCGRVENKVKSCQAARNRLSILWACARHPTILPHLVEKVPSIHSVLVIISIKYLPISKIETIERFLFRYVEPREYRVFRCVVRIWELTYWELEAIHPSRIILRPK